MKGSYSQLYIQIIFAVKHRENLLALEWKDDLNKYISGIIKEKGHKALIVNGYRDHVHILARLKPGMSISDLVRDVKNNSTNFINKNNWVKGKFSWQPGFGAFSYSKSDISRVYQYIENQEEHHKKKSFKEEYHDFLKAFNVAFEEKYLFEWIEE